MVLGPCLYTSPTMHEGVVGRPRYFIPPNVLEPLVTMGFSVPQIADIKIAWYYHNTLVHCWGCVYCF